VPSELIAVFAALGGTLVGGFINYFATRSMKDREWRLSLARDQIVLRQKLYFEFLVETQRLVVQAMENKLTSAIELNAMNSKFAEISLVASQPVVEIARILADYAVSSHAQDDSDSPRNFFALKERFIEAARKDIASVQET
jgi:hypothetical protein